MTTERRLVFECPEPTCGLRCFNWEHRGKHGDCRNIPLNLRGHCLWSPCLDDEGNEFTPGLEDAGQRGVLWNSIGKAIALPGPGLLCRVLGRCRMKRRMVDVGVWGVQCVRPFCHRWYPGEFKESD